MDQLKPILEQCKKHIFWIVTGVAVLLGSVAYFLMNGTINSAYDTQAKALDNHYNNIQQVNGKASTHPNAKSQEKMKGIIDSVAEEVRQAWEMQYDRQAKILVWPDEIKKNNFALVSKLESMHPIELTTEYPTEPKGITKAYKDIYARYFDKDMPRLAKIIGVNWKGEASESSVASSMGGGYGDMMGGEGMDGMDGYGDSMGGMGMGMGGYGAMPGAAANAGPRDLVTWSESSQSELLNSIRMWQSKTPSVFEILYTQENMWILEGLFNIIKKTNGKAQANFQCIIKEIEFIRIGKTAVGQAGTLAGMASGGYMGGMGMGMGEGMGMEMGGDGEYDPYDGDMMGSEGGDMYGASTAVSRDPADNRYVDANFVAVTGEDLRSKMQSSSPEDAYFAVAKRVPVRMRFSIDQRKVHEFLANCGSADLMLEIRQVRLGDTVAAAGAGGGGMSSYGGGPELGFGEGMGMGEGLGTGGNGRYVWGRICSFHRSSRL